VNWTTVATIAYLISWVIFIVVGVPGALIILRPVWYPFLQSVGLA